MVPTFKLTNFNFTPFVLLATEEPPTKRLRGNNTPTTSDLAAGATPDNHEDVPTFDTDEATYSAELIVFDRYKTCLLTDGDYELLLHNENESTETKKNTTFESKFKNKV